jgi:hypothetical protein
VGALKCALGQRPASAVLNPHMARQKKRKKNRARGGGAQPLGEPVDRQRTVVVEALSMGDQVFEEPHLVVVIEPVRLESGDDLYFHSPFVVPFYLLKAKKLRDKAEPRRLSALRRPVRTDDGTYRPKNPSQVLDALEDLSLAVILSLAAIEAKANDMIGRLPDDVMVEIPTRVGGKTVAVMRDKAAMDWLSLGDKIARAAPLLHGSESIKSTVAWQKYKRLSRLRNALVHPRREAVNDPLKPSVFGRLLTGAGSRAPEDAAEVIEAMEPGWMPREARAELGL